MNGSISLLRTNVALTSNIKLMVDSNYKLYLESYSSNKELSANRFKKYLINHDSFLSYKYAQFYKDLPADLAFEVANDIKSDNINNSYANQLNDLYFSGPRNVENTLYEEEFQYNTTLKINPNKLPKKFIIFRSDGPGVIDLNETNIKDYLSSLKHVKSFDLTEQSDLGKLLYKNYIYDDKIPNSPININFKDFEFSNWNGYDYNSGGTVSKSFLINDMIHNQMTDFELEKMLTDGFRKNQVICSNYINISYLFNDETYGIFMKDVLYELELYPFIHKLIRNGYIKNTEYTLIEDIAQNKIFYKFNTNITYNKKWTINQYTGFYVDDLKHIAKISPYKTVNFRLGEGITIVNNVFKDALGNNIRPTINAVTEEYPTYIKINNEFYLIELNKNNEYVIISDIIINDTLDNVVLNAELPIKLVFENNKTYLKYNDNNYYVNDKLKYYLIKNSVILINILDDYYSIKMDNNFNFYIDTDELIECDNLNLYRKKGQNDAQINSTLILIKDNPIMFFNFYVLQFTDIADWDYNRVNTKQTYMEYEKHDNINYQRPIITQIDVKSLSLPKEPYYDKNYQILTIDGNNVITPYKPDPNTPIILPMSSEYGANGDLYVINGSQLTTLWNINQSINKWGLSGSISNSGYKYKLNTDSDTHGLFNIIPNMYDDTVNMSNMTLDWFYTLGKPINYDYDDSDSLINYGLDITGNNLYPTTINRTLNLELYDDDPNAVIPSTNSIYNFNHKFLKSNNTNFDYFDYIFNTYVKYKNTNNKYNYVDRIAYTSLCDNVNGPYIFFKGFYAFLKWNKLENPNTPSNFTTIPATDLSNYKFAILLSGRRADDLNDAGKAGINIIINKDFKNILINIYVLTTQHNAILSSDYKERDTLYNEEVIKYAVKDNNGDITWIDSELTTKQLTLFNFIKVLNNYSNVIEGFSMGMQFDIVDSNKTKYLINKVEAFNDITGNYVWFHFIDDLQFNEKEWIKFNNNSLLNLNEYEGNLQIVEKKGNKKYKIKFATDQTLNCDLINNALANNTPLANPNIFYFTNEESILPLSFNIIEPDIIKIDKNANQMIPNDSCNVTPSFSNDTYNSVTVSNNGLIPMLYINDSISRTYLISNDINYTDYYNKPKIYRFSGDYEPILTPIKIFNNTYLYKLKNDLLENNIIDILNTTYDNININNAGYYSTNMLLILNVATPTILKPGNILYISDTNKTFNIISDVIHISNDGLEITLNYNIKNEMLPLGYQSLITFQSNYTTQYNITLPPSDFYIIDYMENNIHFEYNLNDFGIIKDEIITKVYDTVNPLKTSNTDIKSFNIFPMIDEHGVTTVNHNIFKSTWDLKYYYMTIKNII